MEAILDGSNIDLDLDSYANSVAAQRWSRNGSAMSGSGLSFNKAGQLTLAPETSSPAGKRHEQRYG